NLYRKKAWSCLRRWIYCRRPAARWRRIARGRRRNAATSPAPCLSAAARAARQEMVHVEPVQPRAIQEKIVTTQGMRGAAGLGLAWVLAVGTVTSAATYEWLSDRGRFDVAANWRPVGVPGIGDLAVFDLSQAYTVQFTRDQSA